MTNTKATAKPVDLAGELGEELYSNLLTLDQAQTALRVSKYTLGKMIKAGEITTVKLGSRKYIGKGTLTAFIAKAVQGSQNGTSPS